MALLRLFRRYRNSLINQQAYHPSRQAIRRNQHTHLNLSTGLCQDSPFLRGSQEHNQNRR